jgi:FtsH-binding integral membrane protein
MSASVDSFVRNLNDKFEAPVRTHLKNVYSYLTLSVMTAAVGAYVNVFSSLAAGLLGPLSILGSIGLLLGLHFTPDNGKNLTTRTAMLLGFAFCSGVGLGPLIGYAYALNPAIIFSALLGTTLIFACFTLVSLFAPDGSYLYLGGTLLSALSMLCWAGIANIFFRSAMMFQVQIWAGLLIFCGFVVYDTQAIIAKRRMGDKDVIRHSLDLFIDFIHIFRKVLVLLIQKEQNDNQRKKNNRR